MVMVSPADPIGDHEGSGRNRVAVPVPVSHISRLAGGVTGQEAEHELLEVGLVDLVEVMTAVCVVRRLDGVDQVEAHRKHRAAVGIAGSFPGELDVVRGQRLAVRPLEIGAQLPGDGQEVLRDAAVLHRGQLGGQHRHELAVLVDRRQRAGGGVGHLAHDGGDGQILVERGRLLGDDEDRCAALGRRGRRLLGGAAASSSARRRRRLGGAAGCSAGAAGWSAGAAAGCAGAAQPARANASTSRAKSEGG